ncbi:hypothetical protein RD792_010527 [Penstemon davidsonii]|uniref:Uncharacterized protein n=1 Tax=Penstemon davidsonii TaxID=160366 RepID=A0ABR0D3L7_9LAMI|nr:hypothetical protein RD792_010527 [Penstemon davidsonii]
MGSDSDWDYPLTEEELEAIDAAFSAADSALQPMNKRHVSNCTNVPASSHSPPKTKIRRRLPDSLFSISHCSTKRSYRTSNTTYRSPFQDVKFGGCIVYSRTTEEVERAADELLNFVETKTKKEGQCILGLDIEWRPTFRRGKFSFN